MTASRAFLWVAATLLATEAVGLFCYGTWSAWARRADFDMQSRAVEYELFRDGTYPNAHLESPPASHLPLYTVYPPYAFPMYAFFFEPGGVVQGRIVIQCLTALSYLAMGFYAYRTLIPYGRPIAAIGALAGPAIAGNGTALSLGQFSIICTGLVVMQMMLLDRGKPLAAGACWALAMIKPQIALPFLLLFVVTRQLKGLLFGAALLAGATLFAVAWTEVPMAGVFMHWTRGMSLKFTEESTSIGPGTIAKALGGDHRTMQVIAVAIVAMLAVPACLFVRRLGPRGLVPLAGFCSVTGMLVCYHRHYDNVMLFPAVLATIAFAASTRRPAAVGVATALVALLLVPQRLLNHLPPQALLQGAVWLVAGILPLWKPAPPGTLHASNAAIHRE